MADASLSESVLASDTLRASSLFVVMAQAMDAQRVRVTLSNAPQAMGRGVAGDALNPDTWSVSEMGTGVVVVALAASMVSDRVVDVYLAAPFNPAPDTYVISCPTLLDTYGGLISSPSSAAFSGLGTVTTAPPPSTTTDLANKPTPLSNTVGGTLVIGPGGDYVQESGAALMKKLILRRLTTPKGGFFHLPDYGAGIEEKTLVHPSQLPEIHKDVVRQIAREPGISDVTANVTWDPAEGILYVTGKGVMEGSGLPVSFETMSSPSAPSYGGGGGYATPPALPLVISFEASPPWTTGYGSASPTAVVTVVGTGFSRVTSMDLVSDPLGQTIAGVPFARTGDTSFTFDAADVVAMGGLPGTNYRVRLDTPSGYSITVVGFGFEISAGHAISGTITGDIISGVEVDLRPGADYGSYSDVWVNPADPLHDVWAVGAHSVTYTGETTHWDGVAWVSISNPFGSGQGISGVWGAASDDVWAVGMYDQIIHWNGSAWSIVSNPSSGYMLQRVSGRNSTDVWAVGYGTGSVGEVLHWNGSAWSIPYTTGSYLLWNLWVNPAVANDVWVVGGIGTTAFAVHWNGTSWAPYVVSGAAHPLFAVWGSDSSDVWAIDEVGTVFHWDGSVWSAFGATISPILSMWGNSSSNIFAAGTTSANVPSMYHWNGAAWDVVEPLPIALGLLTGIHGDPATGCFWVVGITGDLSFTLIYFDGSSIIVRNSVTTNTAPDGTYFFDSPLAQGAYSVMPMSTLEAFAPALTIVPYSGTPVTGVDFVGTIPVSASIAVAGSNNGIAYSTDRGASWNASDLDVGLFKAICWNESWGRFLTVRNDTGRVFFSENGQSWTQSTAPRLFIEGEVVGMTTLNQGVHAGRVVAVGVGDSGNTSWYSDDGGLSWSSVDVGDQRLVSVDQSGSSSGGHYPLCAVGADSSTGHGIVSKSEDEGATWDVITDVSETTFNAVCHIPGSGAFFIASSASVIYMDRHFDFVWENDPSFSPIYNLGVDPNTGLLCVIGTLGDASGMSAVSDDFAETFTAEPTGAFYRGICNDGVTFIAVGNTGLLSSGGVAAAATDGATWVTTTLPTGVYYCVVTNML